MPAHQALLGARALPPGTLVRLETGEGEALGTFMFNRLPLISARLISTDPAAEISGRPTKTPWLPSSRPTVIS